MKAFTKSMVKRNRLSLRGIVFGRCRVLEPSSDGVDDGFTTAFGPEPKLRRSEETCRVLGNSGNRDFAVRRRRVSPAASGHWLRAKHSQSKRQLDLGCYILPLSKLSHHLVSVICEQASLDLLWAEARRSRRWAARRRGGPLGPR